MLDLLPSLIIKKISDMLEDGFDIISLSNTSMRLKKEVTTVQQWYEEKIRKSCKKWLLYNNSIAKLAVEGEISLHVVILKFDIKGILIPFDIHTPIPPHNEAKGCCITTNTKHLLNELLMAKKSIAILSRVIYHFPNKILIF